MELVEPFVDTLGGSSTSWRPSHPQITWTPSAAASIPATIPTFEDSLFYDMWLLAGVPTVWFGLLVALGLARVYTYIPSTSTITRRNLTLDGARAPWQPMPPMGSPSHTKCNYRPRQQSRGRFVNRALATYKPDLVFETVLYVRALLGESNFSQYSGPLCLRNKARGKVVTLFFVRTLAGLTVSSSLRDAKILPVQWQMHALWHGPLNILILHTRTWRAIQASPWRYPCCFAVGWVGRWPGLRQFVGAGYGRAVHLRAERWMGWKGL